MSESTMSEFVELAKAAEELKEATLPNSTQFHYYTYFPEFKNALESLLPRVAEALRAFPSSAVAIPPDSLPEPEDVREAVSAATGVLLERSEDALARHRSSSRARQEESRPELWVPTGMKAPEKPAKQHPDQKSVDQLQKSNFSSALRPQRDFEDGVRNNDEPWTHPPRSLTAILGSERADAYLQLAER
ncbi:hypothetical protein H632_c601p3, partial [Helicosporidium sp. ATCC 50920]